MGSNYMLNKKFYIIFYMSIILLVLSLTGFSFSYYKANVTGNTTVQSGTAGTIKINYQNEQVLTVTNAKPIYENGYKEYADKLEFTITGSGNTTPGCYRLELDITRLDAGLKNSDFRWILYDKTNSGPVAGGNFLNANAGTPLILLDNQLLVPEPNETNISYALYVFIKYNEDPNINQISMMNTTFSGNIRATSSAGTCTSGSPLLGMNLSSDNGRLFIGGSSTTITVNGEGLGTISCESQNKSIATCTTSGRNVTISPGTSEGNVILKIKESNGTILEYTAQVLDSGISLNSTSGTGYLPQPKNSALSTTITGVNYGNLSCASKDESKATCSINGSNLVITPVAVTSSPVKITVTESNANNTAEYLVTVKNSTYQITVAKGTNSAGIGNIAVTGCTGSNPFTCTYNSSVKIYAPANAGYTVNSTLSSSNTSLFANKTNNSQFTLTDKMVNGQAITLTANATINTYTLNLSKGTGVLSMSASGCTQVTAGVKYTCSYGASVTVTGVASAGYTISSTLTGTNISNKTNGAAFTMPVPSSGSAVTLTANATANTYTITLNNQSATYAGSTGATATYNSAMPGITIPQKIYRVTYNANEGSVQPSYTDAPYSFGGYWTGTNGSGIQYYNPGGGSARSWTTVGGATLYAQWTVTENTRVSLPTPSRSGYDFNGWYTAASGGTRVGGGGTPYTPTASVTLYAQWTKNTMTCSAVNGSDYHYATGTGTNMQEVCSNFCPGAFPYSDSPGGWRGFAAYPGADEANRKCYCYPMTDYNSYNYTIQMTCS